MAWDMAKGKVDFAKTGWLKVRVRNSQIKTLKVRLVKFTYAQVKSFGPAGKPTLPLWSMLVRIRGGLRAPHLWPSAAPAASAAAISVPAAL